LLTKILVITPGLSIQTDEAVFVRFCGEVDFAIRLKAVEVEGRPSYTQKAIEAVQLRCSIAALSP